ncbi:MAG: condensation domain-containing protein [Candidatus Hydrogenedentota bacterium]
MQIETPAPRRYPASFVQQRFWDLDRDMPGAPFYNHAVCARLRGIDAALVRKCIAAVFERHEILRTRLGLVSGEGLVQEALPPPAAIESGALDSGYEHNTRDLVQYFSDQAKRVLPLEGAPAVRAALFELPCADVVFLLVSHPCLLDNASSRLLGREFGLSYGQLLSGGQIRVPMPCLQYGEFAYWQRKWFDDTRRRRYAAFWSHYLRGALLSEFPDWPHPGGTFAPRRIVFHFGASVKRAVAAAAAEFRAGPASIFLTAYCAAIHREIVDAVVPVGVLVANRGRPEIQHTLGNFANSVIVLVGPDLHAPWPQRAREIHGELMKVLPYSDLPLDVSI